MGCHRGDRGQLSTGGESVGMASGTGLAFPQWLEKSQKQEEEETTILKYLRAGRRSNDNF